MEDDWQEEEEEEENGEEENDSDSDTDEEDTDTEAGDTEEDTDTDTDTNVDDSEIEEEEEETEETYTTTYYISGSSARIYFDGQASDPYYTFNWGDGEETTTNSNNHDNMGSNAGSTDNGVGHSYDETGDYEITVTSVSNSFKPTVIAYAEMNDAKDNLGAFHPEENLTGLLIGKNCIIGAKAFKSCSNLVSVSFVDDYSYYFIYGNSFYKCTSLESVTIPDSILEICASAFRGCSALKNLDLGDGPTYLDSKAFYGCTSLEAIDFEKTQHIMENCFQGCTSLTTITFTSKIKEIAEGAFKNCTSLASVTIPNSDCSIADNAFTGCTALETIILGDEEVDASSYK